jgi:amidohydrolase
MRTDHLLADLITSRIHDAAPDLVNLSRRIHQHPELGLEEFEAVAAAREILRKYGYDAAPNYGGLATSFRANAGNSYPRIAVLAEYDALPSIGHGCGHNIICAAAIGAFIGAAAAVEKVGGSVAIIGTPAEENHGAKAALLDNGCFDDVDAAVMVHPWCGDDAAIFQSLGVRTVSVEFHGVAAHASANPSAGRNALDAVVFAYQGIASLRQHIADSSRIHGIILNGGIAENTVPHFAKASFLVRADNLEDLAILSSRVDGIFDGAALMTGTRVERVWDSTPCYLPIKNNHELLTRYAKHMTDQGRSLHPRSETTGMAASTDFGNVSQRIPGIHPAVGIAPLAVVPHSQEFAAASTSPAADKAIIDASVALALTMADFLSDGQLRAAVTSEFAGPSVR